MNIKKGFTLIELLAVIVILAIIALIATPLIMNVIDEARRESFKASVYGIVNSAENEYVLSELKNKDGDIKTIYFIYENGIETSNIEGKTLQYKGKKPLDGNLTLNKNGKISLALYDGKYCATKDLNNYEVMINKTDIDDCDINIPVAQIVLNGDIIVEINMNDNYIEMGYNAFNSEGDNISSEIEVKIYKDGIEQESINTSSIGEYVIYYIYETDDEYVEVRRTVKIMDNEPPIITVPSSTTIKTTEVAGFDLLEGVSITDNSGEEIVPEIIGNLSSLEGDYEIIYKAKDSSGNEAIKIRIITVIKASYLMSTSSGTSTTPYLGGPIKKESIESIVFLNNNTVPEGVIGSWDVSKDRDGSIKAWYKDVDSNGLYELTIGGNGKVYANSNSAYLFLNLKNLTSINFNNFDTSNVIDMSYMFTGVSNLTTLDISSFNTSNVTNMRNMFASMTNLTQLNLNGIVTKKVTDMQSMFYGLSSLTTLDVSNFDTLKVTNMNSMFYGCKELISLDLSSFDTPEVTDMSEMFYGSEKLQTLNISNFNTSNVTNMMRMFFVCRALISLDLSSFDTAKVTNMAEMFVTNSSLVNLNISSFDTSNVTTMKNMFQSCSKLEALDLSSFNTSKVTDMFQMFSSNGTLTSLDLSSFDTSNVTNMRYMFGNMVSLTSLNISNFNTSKVTDMDYMFYNTKLTSLDLSHFNTSNVTTMARMFNDMIYLTNLNVSSFNTSNVTNMSYMFSNCRSLTTLNLKNAEFTKSPTSTSMFSSAKSGMTIYTKNATTQAWLQARNSNANVIILP